jgi:hypothetical protein
MDGLYNFKVQVLISGNICREWMMKNFPEWRGPSLFSAKLRSIGFRRLMFSNGILFKKSSLSRRVLSDLSSQYEGILQGV